MPSPSSKSILPPNSKLSLGEEGISLEAEEEGKEEEDEVERLVSVEGSEALEEGWAELGGILEAGVSPPKHEVRPKTLNPNTAFAKTPCFFIFATSSINL